MKLNQLIPTGGLCLVASLLAWQAPGSAQGLCYLVDSSGQVVNLEHLCQGSSAPESTPSQPAAVPESNANSSPGTRSYTVVGPVRSGSSTRSTISTTSTSTSSSASTTSTSTPALPFDVNPRTTTIEILQTDDFTITTIDRPDRVVNGVVLEGRDGLIIGPGRSDDAAEGESTEGESTEGESAETSEGE